MASHPKEELAEVGRVLALNLDHGRIHLKGVPISKSLDLLTIENVAEDMATTSASSREASVKVLKAPGPTQAYH